MKLPEFEIIFRKFGENLKLIINEEIKKISKKIVFEENNKIILEKIVNLKK